MRLYLDQMLRVETAERLRAEGHDVLRAEDAGQARADDAEILERARAEDRVLITLDEHFGNWVVLPLSRHPGVVRLKVHPTTRENVEPLLLAFLSQRNAEEFRNHLIIISPRGERWINTASETE